MFVWDFHGVLEQNTELATLEISNSVLEKQGYVERFTKDDIIKLYGKKWFEFFEYLLPYEPRETHLRLQSLCFTNQDWSIIEKHIIATPNAGLVLEAISKKHQQIVISNTQPESITRFLTSVSLEQYFDTSSAIAVNAHNNLGMTKADALREFITDKNFDDFIFIGDSPGDMELKKVFGGVTYLFVHPHLKHKNCEADYRITDLREVLKEL